MSESNANISGFLVQHVEGYLVYASSLPSNDALSQLQIFSHKLSLIFSENHSSLNAIKSELSFFVEKINEQKRNQTVPLSMIISKKIILKANI